MNRIAISIEQKENRRLLSEWLEQYYEVAIAKDGIWQGKTIPLLAVLRQKK